MQSVSAVILSKNEENNIVDCMEGLQWCNEVIVIDDNSHDRTVQIAKQHGAKVVKHALENDFSRQRNFALSLVKNDWVFFVDADEHVDNKLKNEIITTLTNTQEEAFYIKRVDFLWGRRLLHGETGNAYFLRLAKKNTGKWAGRVHEVWVSSKKAGELKNSLFHFPHVTVREFLDEINYYSSLRAQELYERKITTNWLQIILYPKAKFIVNYFLRLGFLDGVPGLLLAFFMSFHSFLVRSKLWLLWQKK